MPRKKATAPAPDGEPLAAIESPVEQAPAKTRRPQQKAQAADEPTAPEAVETKPERKKEKPLLFYSLDNILTRKAQYNVIFGERSNGKSYSVLLYGLKQYVAHGKQTGIVRRFEDDIKGGKADSFYDGIISNGEIERLTNGRWNKVRYYNRRFYLARHDENLDRDIYDNTPFAFTFAINTATRYKSNSYPDITTICFDEFLDRKWYLPNEFADFMSIISTIVRQRDDVTIFMLGNTVNKSCPYFTEMGLKHVPEMKQGVIEVYTYGNSDLKVAVEYAANLNEKKPSDKYFAFDNPKLRMITSGVWEMAMYPHLPYKYKPNQIVLTYFIEFENNLLQAEIVSIGTAGGSMMFTYIHRKTTPIKNPDRDIVYTMEYDPRPNYVRRLTKPTTKWQEKIAYFFKKEKVFYQDNEVGEIVRNYILTSARESYV